MEVHCVMMVSSSDFDWYRTIHAVLSFSGQTVKYLCEPVSHASVELSWCFIFAVHLMSSTFVVILLPADQFLSTVNMMKQLSLSLVK